MTLRESLANKNNSLEEVDEIISYMVNSVLNGDDPEELLDAEGLEPDYVFDLLSECK